VRSEIPSVSPSGGTDLCIHCSLIRAKGIKMILATPRTKRKSGACMLAASMIHNLKNSYQNVQKSRYRKEARCGKTCGGLVSRSCSTTRGIKVGATFETASHRFHHQSSTHNARSSLRRDNHEILFQDHDQRECPSHMKHRSTIA
jgi:hypothetical protein